MNDVVSWGNMRRLERTADALRTKGFETFVVENRKRALEKLLGVIPADCSIGAGGSVTLKQLDIIKALTGRGNRLFDHWQEGLSYEERLELRRKQLLADVFLASTNALTEQGELINVDGVGNRVAALSFGPKHVIVVAGVNKLVRDIHEGIERIKGFAGPVNARRLERDLPCARLGVCVDCQVPERICRVVSIVLWPPSKTRYSVCLVNEELGF
jgi:hypothetical protein